MITRAKGLGPRSPARAWTSAQTWSSEASTRPHPTSCGWLTSHYCTFSGWVYAATCHRRVLPPGGGLATVEERTHRFALDALEMDCEPAPRRRGLSGLTHHSDKGAQYVAIRATPSAWPRPVRSPRSARPVAPTITPWPRPSTRCLEMSWSETVAVQGHRRPRDRCCGVQRLVQPPTPARRDPVLSHPSSTRSITTVITLSRLPSGRHFRASTEPGARHVLDEDPPAVGQHRGVGGVPRHRERLCDPGDGEGPTTRAFQGPPRDGPGPGKRRRGLSNPAQGVS